MKNVLSLLIPMLIFISCNNTSSSNNIRYQKQTITVKSAKETIIDYERHHPNENLSVETQGHRNLIGQIVIEGEITNNAKYTTYKDAQIIVNYISKTQSIIGTETYTQYEYIAPGSKLAFKIKAKNKENKKAYTYTVKVQAPVLL